MSTATETRTRRARSEPLVQRCVAVGWMTVNTEEGVKVKTPKGVYHLPEWFASQQAFRAAELELENRGLLKAETAHQRAEDTLDAAAEKLTAPPAKAAKSTAAANRAALVKAAGPYLVEPEEVELDWFTREHPAPWPRLVWMTAPIADHLMTHHNIPGAPGKAGTNRPRSEKQIRDWRDRFLNDEYRCTHQGMASNTLAQVQDAQHRMGGLIEAAKVRPGLRIPTFYTVGMPVENYKYIDEGYARNANQLLTQGGEANGGTLKTMIRLLMAVQSNDEDLRTRMRLKATNQQLVDWFESDPDELRLTAALANSYAKKAFMAPGPFAAGYYMLRNANGYNNGFVELFMHGVGTGERGGPRADDRMRLPNDDPREALRNTLFNYRARHHNQAPNGMDQYGLMITAWNNMLIGKHVTGLRWDRESPIPQIMVCKDDGQSAPPRALHTEYVR